MGVSSKWSVTTALQAVNVGSSPAIPTKRVIKKKRKIICAKAIGVRKVKNRPIDIGMWRSGLTRSALTRLLHRFEPYHPSQY